MKPSCWPTGVSSSRTWDPPYPSPRWSFGPSSTPGTRSIRQNLWPVCPRSTQGRCRIDTLEPVQGLRGLGTEEVGTPTFLILCIYFCGKSIIHELFRRKGRERKKRPNEGRQKKGHPDNNHNPPNLQTKSRVHRQVI